MALYTPQPGERTPHMGKGDWEITTGWYNGEHFVQLKYATGFFMGTGEIDPKTKKEKRIPCFKRWFITEHEGSRWLCNAQRLDCWTVVPGTRLYNIFDLEPRAVIGMIEDGTVDNWWQYGNKPRAKTRGERIQLQAMWSLEYDGMPIWCILDKHPKMTFDEVKRIIEGEGGTVDECGLIHKR